MAIAWACAEQTRDGAKWPRSGCKHGVDVPVTIAAKDHPITAATADFPLHEEIDRGSRHGYRKSRVVCLMGGHDRTACDDPSYRRLVARAIRRAAKRSH